MPVASVQRRPEAANVTVLPPTAPHATPCHTTPCHTTPQHSLPQVSTAGTFCRQQYLQINQLIDLNVVKVNLRSGKGRVAKDIVRSYYLQAIECKR